VAGATFAATVVAGFVLLPGDSTNYWLRRGFDDAGRIAQKPFISTANTSLGGLLIRLHVPVVAAVVAAVALAAVAVAVAATAHRRGYAVLGIAIVGMASAAAAPFSWSHHWVWFAPLIVHLGYRGYVLRSNYAAWAMWVLCALLGGWFTSFGDNRESGVLSLRPGGVGNDIVPGSYVLVFLAVLVGTAAWLWRSAAAGSAATVVPAGAQNSGAG
jgi:alpha-1,2-mannosyltransferase